jgi:cell division protein ZapE
VVRSEDLAPHVASAPQAAERRASPAPKQGGTLAQWMAEQASLHGFELDQAQRAVMPSFQRLYDALAAFNRKDNRLMRLLARRRLVKGLYLWGGVGRGKSFLMDNFFSIAPLQRKTRAHFHRFMQDIHQQLAALQGQSDPLATIAKRIARDARLLCLDEFLVTDIADAMLMRRLVEGLLAEGVVVVTTSNSEPDALYLNGLQRGQFLPAIALLKQHLEVVNVDGGQDYRLRALEKLGVYHCPLAEATERRMTEEFLAIARHEGDVGTTVDVDGRSLAARKVASGVAWFEFAELCQKPRGQVDFIEISRRFHTVLVSDVPRMFADERDAARRFAWMVDEFYDRRVKLIISAAAPVEGLLDPTTVGRDLERTVSRLIEMQTRHYLTLPHLP